MIVHLPEGPFLVNASTDEVSIPGLLVSASIVHCSGAMSELPLYRRAANTLAEICGYQARHHLVPFPKSYRRPADTLVWYISCDEYAGSQCFCCRDGCWSFVSAGRRYNSEVVVVALGVACPICRYGSNILRQSKQFQTRSSINTQANSSVAVAHTTTSTALHSSG